MGMLLACLTSREVYESYRMALLDSDEDHYYDLEWEEQALEMGGWLGPDCDDEDPDIHPGATELCDGLDQDCDELVDEDTYDYVGWFEDYDADGHGNPNAPVTTCPIPPDAVQDDTDCNDHDMDMSPTASESCNGLDDDCDGETDEGIGATYHRDGDSDNFADPEIDVVVCSTPPDGYIELVVLER
ncbi:MAG TPA: putative metal-binding motif-containing protein [Myxococcota bacterium]|nr:putative metal-binding motif-containing protein [Myxococcota bacterium]